MKNKRGSGLKCFMVEKHFVIQDEEHIINCREML